jgi:hypothetical protein
MKVRKSAFGAEVFAAARLVSQNSDQNLAASYSCKKID